MPCGSGHWTGSPQRVIANSFAADWCASSSSQFPLPSHSPVASIHRYRGMSRTFTCKINRSYDAHGKPCFDIRTGQEEYRCDGNDYNCNSKK
eukprot:6111030-Amphidinium_carterae.1